MEAACGARVLRAHPQRILPKAPAAREQLEGALPHFAHAAGVRVAGLPLGRDAAQGQERPIPVHRAVGYGAGPSPASGGALPLFRLHAGGGAHRAGASGLLPLHRTLEQAPHPARRPLPSQLVLSDLCASDPPRSLSSQTCRGEDVGVRCGRGWGRAAVLNLPLWPPERSRGRSADHGIAACCRVRRGSCRSDVLAGRHAGGPARPGPRALPVVLARAQRRRARATMLGLV